jgi:hypothetical protein
VQVFAGIRSTPRERPSRLDGTGPNTQLILGHLRDQSIVLGHSTIGLPHDQTMFPQIRGNRYTTLAKSD